MIGSRNWSKRAWKLEAMSPEPSMTKEILQEREMG